MSRSQSFAHMYNSYFTSHATTLRCGWSDGIVAISQSMYPILQNVPLIIKRRKTHFCHFQCVQDVVGWAKQTKFSLSGFFGIFENAEETVVTYVLFHIIFLNSFDFLLRFTTTGQTVHFGSETDEFEGRSEPVSLFILPKTRWFFFEYRRWCGSKLLVSNKSIASPMSLYRLAVCISQHRESVSVKSSRHRSWYLGLR